MNIYYSYSIDGAATWEPNTKVTPVLAQGFSPSSDFYGTGDYITVASVNEKAQAVWGDDRAGNTEIFTATLTMSSTGGVSTTGGELFAWGRNDYGQLGDGTNTNRLNPVQVNGLTDIIAVAAGYRHSLAVKKDGTVWAWGSNAYGELGDGTQIEKSTPVQVIGLTDVVSVAAGDWFSLALKKDGTVWAWGMAGYVGVGTNGHKLTPVQVIGLTDVVAIAAGDWHSLALKKDGTV